MSNTHSRHATGYRRWVSVLAIIAAGVSWGFAAPQANAEAATSVAAGSYLNSAKVVQLNGKWTTQTSSNATGGTFSNLAAAGYAQLSFSGTGARWITRTNSSSGIGDVFIDGVKKKSVDLYTAKTAYQRVVYAVTGLRQGGHTIRIVRTGTKNAASIGRNLTLDSFAVLDSTAPSALAKPSAVAQQTGARISWAASRNVDIAGYRVYRQRGTAGASTLIGTATAPTTSFLDIDLARSSTFVFRVAAVDTSGNVSGLSLATAVTTPAAPPATRLRYANCPPATTIVSNRTELASALAQAGPGTVIRLNPGKYSGQVDINIKATATSPAWICGPRSAVIDGGGVARRGGIRIDASAHVVVSGMTVRNSIKGIMVMNSSAVTISDTRVENIGDEGIHLLNFTTDSTVVGNSISNTGLVDPDFGEGVYVGTAGDNWCLFSGCKPDRSDRNAIVSNDISHTTAESIEAKVATSGGTISNNTINGLGLRPSSYALIYVKGNDYVVSANTGTNSPTDGVLVIQRNVGWGLRNLVFGNQFYGSIRGYAVHLDTKDLGNLLGCGTGAAPGSIARTNATCQL